VARSEDRITSTADDPMTNDQRPRAVVNPFCIGMSAGRCAAARPIMSDLLGPCLVIETARVW
jgi:hypothetical protein